MTIGTIDVRVASGFVEVPAPDAGLMCISTTASEDDEAVRVSRLTLTSSWPACLEVKHPRNAPRPARL